MLHKISAAGLALIVLFSTLSFRVDLHLCAGSVVDVSFAQEELSCAATLMGELSDEAHNAMREMGCCDDLQFQLEGQDELQNTTGYAQVDNLDYTSKMTPDPGIVFLEYPGDAHIFTSYVPPPPIGDIHILYQSFLL